jgi:hypothetical protein
MGRLSDRGVVHVQVRADSPNDHLTRIQTHADPQRDAVLTPDALGILLDRLLPAERRVARPDCVVLVRHRRPEERHDPVAHHLIHGAS